MVGNAVGRHLGEYLRSLAGQSPLEYQRQHHPEQCQSAEDRTQTGRAMLPQQARHHGYLGHAGHANRHQGGGDETLAAGFKDAGSKGSGHIAPQSQQHRDDYQAVQAEPVHDRIHQYREPGQIAHIFQQA